MSDNPFPGPQPYRSRDRARFCGRVDLATRLVRGVLAHGILTVYGPSGAGKSSLMQASVLPTLADEYDVRLVSVDRWPQDIKPLTWLLDAMVEQLALGQAHTEGAPLQLAGAVRLAEQRSEQPMVIYLDQLEQLLFPGRPAEHLEELLCGIDALADRAARGLRIVTGAARGLPREAARAHPQPAAHPGARPPRRAAHRRRDGQGRLRGGGAR